MQLDTALALMDEMRARHVPANTHTYSSLINVCVKAGNFPMALGVYNEVGGWAMLGGAEAQGRAVGHVVVEAASCSAPCDARRQPVLTP
jgi:pentatricopeptide repeat protein